jgi:hypothetical protein
MPRVFNCAALLRNNLKGHHVEQRTDLDTTLRDGERALSAGSVKSAQDRALLSEWVSI